MAEQPSRRRFIRGLAATGAVASTAGCAESGGSGTDGETTPTNDTTEGGDTEETTAESGPKQVEDMLGRTVEVPTAVDSVIGLGSGGLRLVTYLDAVDSVVGVEQLETTDEKRPYRPYIHANPELTEKPPIGSRKNPDPELILQQDPDVIVWGWAEEGEADDLQSRLDVPVVALQPGDIDPDNRPLFFESVELLGTVFGREKRARELLTYVKDTIADLDGRTADVPEAERPSTYVGYLGRGKHGFPYTQPLYPPFDFVNTNNVAGGVTEDLKEKKGAARVTVDPEKIIEWDPEYVFVDVGTEEYDALSRPEYEGIQAIEEGKIHAVFPTRDYGINFGTALADAYYVGKTVYPDRYDDVNPVTEANDIYETLVGGRVYEDVAASYGEGFERMDL